MSAEDIRALRKRADMTQEEFAAALGATARSVARWEKGEIVPERLAQRALAHFALELDEQQSPS